MRSRLGATCEMFPPRFLAATNVVFVRNEAVHAHAQIGAQADVFVDGLPISRATEFERAFPVFCVNAADRFNDGKARRRKAVTAALEVFVVPVSCPRAHLGMW